MTHPLAARAKTPSTKTKSATRRIGMAELYRKCHARVDENTGPEPLPNRSSRASNRDRRLALRARELACRGFGIRQILPADLRIRILRAVRLRQVIERTLKQRLSLLEIA